MAETKTKAKKDQKQQDAQGNEISMSANIPDEQEGAEKVDLDQTAKTNDLGDGVHKNSKTFGTVISDYAPDAAGLTPEENAANAEARMGHDEDEIKAKDGARRRQRAAAGGEAEGWQAGQQEEQEVVLTTSRNSAAGREEKPHG